LEIKLIRDLKMVVNNKNGILFLNISSKILLVNLIFSVAPVAGVSFLG